jgi:3-oxoacyl-[acyl-carrier protein] reductase
MTGPLPVPAYVEGHGLLRGRSLLITAAAGVGIGFATARKAVEEGCRAIFVSDIHERRLAEAAERLRAFSPAVQVFHRICDVTKEDQVQALVEAAEESLGGIDVLVNNAASF